MGAVDPARRSSRCRIMTCVPCVAELSKVHAIYEKYGKRKTKRLEIVSLSIDDGVAAVAKFRQDKAHPMPWRHGFVGPDRKSDFYKTMGWSDSGAAVPFYILVDGRGSIVAATPQLSLDELPGLLDDLLK